MSNAWFGTLLVAGALLAHGAPAHEAGAPTKQPDVSLTAFGSEAGLREFLLAGAVDEDAYQAFRMEACGRANPIVVRRPARPDTSPAQATIITGRVQVTDGTPLFGANIFVQSRAISVGSGEDGHFSFSLPPRSVRLDEEIAVGVRSFGYVSREQPIRVAEGDSVDFDVSLCIDLRHRHFVVSRPSNWLGTPTWDTGGITLPRRAGDDAHLRDVLRSEGRVVTIAFSNSRDGLEVTSYRTGEGGRLHPESSFALHSNRYGRVTDHVARIVDGRLVVYAPLSFRRDSVIVLESFPSVTQRDLAARVIIAPLVRRPGDVRHLVSARTGTFEHYLHSLTTCELGRRGPRCAASVILAGPPLSGSVVDGTMVVDTHAGIDSLGRSVPGLVRLRLPFDGAQPTAEWRPDPR